MARFLGLTMIFWILAAGGQAIAESDTDPSSTTWVNDQGTTVRGNWSTGEIIEIKTVEEYYWHKDHYDPSAIYQVAPWLYDPYNLARESGASNENN